MKNLNAKDYDSVLQEAADYFTANGISVIGDGYREVATNKSLFESYVEMLTTGASPDHAAQMAQLMVNTNTGILKESSLTGIQPVASLSMPVIRKLWPKFALKDAVATEVAKTPRFVISYTAPYMFRNAADGSEDRVYIPRGLRDSDGWGKDGFTDADYVEGIVHKELVSEAKTKIGEEALNGTSASTAVVAANTLFTDGAEGTYYIKVAAGSAVQVTFDTAVTTASNVTWQPVDEFLITEVYAGKASAEKDKLTAVKLGKRLGVYGSAVYPFTVPEDPAAEGGTTVSGQIVITTNGKVESGNTPSATVAAIGGDVYLRIRAVKSSEYNEEAWSVGFDIKREDVDIPSGVHLNAPLPVEMLQDAMALYQIDATKETVDLMTNVFAMNLDKEILNFLAGSFNKQPTNEAFFGYPEASEYTVEFDCKPAAGFAGSPKAWREEIKPLIDHLAQRIKNETYLQAGVFVLVANPLDVQILANVDWSFRGGQGNNMDGVDVDYSLGTYVGANTYRVIASTQVPQGAMFVVFLPSSDKQMTYKYYPYTFSTEMGYQDPNRSRVPSIMMTKRHTMHSFLPAIGLVIIKNNFLNGSPYAQWTPVGSVNSVKIPVRQDGK